ncbi:hypothetical protein [Streptomyces sp. G45]|uniref:hypothetical protein n=1 Tax=Streptomyces sp. G45 TaxID=3406627 RepID=UPI003C1E0453
MVADGVSVVRCPVCRHEQAYAAPEFPCVCGAPVRPPVAAGAPATPLAHHTWADDWLTLRCGACGRETDWPHPELGCRCGTVLRVPVAPGPLGGAGGGRGERLTPAHIPLPRTAPTPRPAFRPLPVRGPRDAVTAAALYLRWLGYEDVRDADERPPSGTRLTAPGLVAQVEPSARPASLRDVECAWLTALSRTAACVCFALDDFTPDARGRADELGVPLFRITPTGEPEALNGAADELAARGA